MPAVDHRLLRLRTSYHANNVTLHLYLYIMRELWTKVIGLLSQPYTAFSSSYRGLPESHDDQLGNEKTHSKGSDARTSELTMGLRSLILVSWEFVRLHNTDVQETRTKCTGHNPLILLNNRKNECFPISISIIYAAMKMLPNHELSSTRRCEWSRIR